MCHWEFVASWDWNGPVCLWALGQQTMFSVSNLISEHIIFKGILLMLLGLSSCYTLNSPALFSFIWGENKISNQGCCKRAHTRTVPSSRQDSCFLWCWVVYLPAKCSCFSTNGWVCKYGQQLHMLLKLYKFSHWKRAGGNCWMPVSKTSCLT